jgi:NADH:quinone reductase (non-electrogenic)
MTTRILVLGGGYAGLYTALGLQRRLRRQLRRGTVEVIVVDPQPHMTYQPFLPEAAAGSIEPRHVVVPLRPVLRRCRVLTARVTAIAHENRSVTVETEHGEAHRLDYDVLVVALGAVARVLPIPGLAEEGIGFKTIGEAIYLRNHILSRLDQAAGTTDPVLRRRLLTFTVVGGGFAGVEALAELADMARFATRFHDTIDADDLRWVLVEAAGRILPEVRERLGAYTVRQLVDRHIEVRLGTTVTSFTGGHAVLSDGTEFDTDTVIWTAGARANPVLAGSDLPLDPRGRVVVDAALRVAGTSGAWAAGDNAAVPDLARTATDPAATCPPNAQHAVRQARRLARNIVRTLRDREPTEYRHRNLGAMASLGLHHGVADAFGVPVTGWLAWLVHRTYHLTTMPTGNRKARILLDWTLGGLFRREVVALGQINDPKDEFTRAARTEDAA